MQRSSKPFQVCIVNGNFCKHGMEGTEMSIRADEAIREQATSENLIGEDSYEMI